jgi:signal peptidase I
LGFTFKARELLDVLRRGAPTEAHEKGNWLFDTLKLIAAALIVFFAARTFIIQPYYIPTNSMEKTLSAGDVVLANKLLYGITNPFYGMRMPSSRTRYIIRFPRKPGRMDIVTIKVPSMTGEVTKRVVGLPGEKIKIAKGIVYINGRKMREARSVIPDRSDLKMIRIPPGTYFLLGDNRPASRDSRDWGVVPRDNIIGVLAARIWPLDKVRTFE